jgi:hypothetical protein
VEENPESWLLELQSAFTYYKIKKLLLDLKLYFDQVLTPLFRRYPQVFPQAEEGQKKEEEEERKRYVPLSPFPSHTYTPYLSQGRRRKKKSNRT